MKHGGAAGYNAGCRCDECRDAKRAADRKYRANNREKVRARGRRNRERDPDYIKRWRAANPDRVKELRARWIADNPERYNEARKASRERRADKKREYDLVWRKTPRGRIYNAGLQHARRQAPLTTDGREYALILQNDPCSYCGGKAGTIDHITPIHEGGDGEWTNLAAACRSCNGRKHTKTLLRFIAAA